MARLRPRTDRILGWLLATALAAGFLTTAVHIVIRLVSPPAPDVSDVAPTFALDTVTDGERIDTNALSGMVLLIDFWETTCVGCVGATPKLNRLFGKYADRGFLVVGVNREPGEEDRVRDFIKSRPIDYPVVVDPGEVSSSFGIYATPTVILIGGDGRIFSKHIGAVTEEKLAKEIEAALRAARPRLGVLKIQSPRVNGSST